MERAKLTIITFNTLGIPFLTTHRHKNYLRISRFLLARFKLIAQELNTSQADIILLQEIHLYSLLRYLKKKLTTYPYAYYHRFLYGPKGGLVIFSKQELKKEPFLNFSLRGTFKNKTFVTRIVRNGALICTMKDLPLTFVNTYITGDFSHKWGVENKYTKVQKEQLGEVAEAVKQQQRMKKDCIIAGDININTGSHLYTEFVSSLILTDFFKNAKTYTHHPDFLPLWAISPRLDHIFMTTKYIKPSKITTEELFTQKATLENGKESFLSDHVALKLSFTLKDSQHYSNVTMKQL